MNRRYVILGCISASAPLAELALAQEDCCPGKCCPSTIVVPFPPGGSTDTVARLLAQSLSKKWGSSVVVENVGGAGGLVGASRVANAEPDGKTLLLTNESLSINAAVVPAQGRATFDSLAPISQVTSAPYVLVVPAQSPYLKIQDLISAAQREPGKLTMASAGNASSSHIAGAMLTGLAKMTVSHVPYRGLGPVVTDLIGGQVTFAVLDLPSVILHLRQGKLRALAISGPTPQSSLPSVPTFAQVGVQGLDITSWTGLFSPKALKDTSVRRVAQDVAAALQEQNLKESLASSGLETAPLSATAFASKLSADFRARSATVASQRISRD